MYDTVANTTLTDHKYICIPLESTISTFRVSLIFRIRIESIVNEEQVFFQNLLQVRLLQRASVSKNSRFCTITMQSSNHVHFLDKESFVIDFIYLCKLGCWNCICGAGFFYSRSCIFFDRQYIKTRNRPQMKL